MFTIANTMTLSLPKGKLLSRENVVEESQGCRMAGRGSIIEPTIRAKNIWMLSREYGYLAGAGGVKDVACQLAEALARSNSRSVHVVLPRYGFVDASKHGFSPLPDPFCRSRVLRLPIEMHQPDKRILEEVRFFYNRLGKVHLYLVDADRFRQKSDVYTYSEKDEDLVPWQKKSMGHHDFFAMNLLLQKAALELMIALREKPEVIHCHDGHTAVLPALIRETAGYRSYFRECGCIVTIHNAGLGYHQEVIDLPYAVSITGLPKHLIYENQLDRKFDPFLVAGSYALVNTVSENYARELRETDSDQMTGWLGHELLRRHVYLEGITNGIDPRFFTPELVAGNDPTLRFDPGRVDDDLSGKRRGKKRFLHDLANRKGLEGVPCFGELRQDSDGPLFTFIGRLNEQKGIDILMPAVEELLQRQPTAQMVILGNGPNELNLALKDLTDKATLRGRLCFLQGFSVDLANRVYAAGDFFVIPSHYEPCGLTDFIAQLFGNLPIVHHVGGLVKVIDGVTGIAYSDNVPSGLVQAMERRSTGTTSANVICSFRRFSASKSSIPGAR
jgi:starch synthase